MAGAPRVILAGLEFGESVRWYDGRCWFADWGARQVVAVEPDGPSEVVLRLGPAPFQPISIDWLADATMLVVSALDRALLRQPVGGVLEPYADVTCLDGALNELVVDPRGNAYVNAVGFDFLGGAEFAPGGIALVTADGKARPVADGLAFPNGMAVTADGATLIVAESYGRCLTAYDIEAGGELTNRRVWADLGDGVPDGICLDAEGAVWYADVPNRCCARVRAGGAVLDRVRFEDGCFSCDLGGRDGDTLFVVTRPWHGVATTVEPQALGRLCAVPTAGPSA